MTERAAKTKAKKRAKRKGKFTPGGFDLKVARSRAGLGLFAQEPIGKGRCVIEYRGRALKGDEEYTSRSKYLFEVSRTKTIDGSPRYNRARYINHSCRPNCEIEIRAGRVWVMARRHIKAGEELAYDYGKNYFDSFIKRHGCRCLKCKPPRSARKQPAATRKWPSRKRPSKSTPSRAGRAAR